MRRAVRKTASSLGVVALIVFGYPFTCAAANGPSVGAFPQCVAVSGAAPARTPAARTSQVGHDGTVDADFSFSRTRDGAARITLKAGDLQMDKTVYADGRFQIRLVAGDDEVSAALGPWSLDVERGNRQIHVDIGQAVDEDWLHVKTLLAGSRALRLFRMLAYSLDAATLRSPGGASVQASDAILGYLDGDVAAVWRLGEQMRAARAARVRKASLHEDDGPNECYEKSEAAVVAAANDYGACRKTFNWYSPWQAGCIAVWTLQAESAWFQFLACSAIPIKTE